VRQAAGRRRVREMALSRVAEQRETSVASHDDQVHKPVAVEVAEGGVAAPTAAGQAHRPGHFLEPPVDIAVHPVPGGRGEEQVEVGVVIEIHE